MNITVATPALLFPAVSLLMLAYTNRFLAIASLIRSLHDTWKTTGESNILLQIQNLRLRVRFIRDMQALGVMAISFCVGSMLLLFLQHERSGQIMFCLSLFLMLGSLVLSMLEIYHSVGALNVQLQDIEKERKSQDQGPGLPSPSSNANHR